MAEAELHPMRKCSKCLCSKPATEEFFNRYTGARLKRQCRECTAAGRKAWALAKKNGTFSASAVCDHCGLAFEKASGAQLRCSLCAVKVQAERDKARGKRDTYNPHYAKAYYGKNGAKVRKYGAEWYRQREESMDPEQRAAVRKKWAVNARNRRLRKPLQFRVHDMMRKSLRGEYRSRNLEALLGYSIDALASHLEKQFLPGMTWDNISEWHVDHILPQSMFHYTSSEDNDFKRCWSITNLRPLWAAENQKKSGTRTHLI